MLDQLLNQLSNTTDSMIHLQQELTRQWIQQWSPLPGATTPKALAAPGRTDPGPAPQGVWADVLSDILNRQRENLDNAYRVGIRAYEDACRVAEAKNPTQLLTLTEELWWQAFATLKVGS